MACKARILAAEDEGVARHERFEEAVLHLAEHASAAPDQRLAHGTCARAHEAHLQHGGGHNRADVHAILLGDPAVADPPAAFLILADFGESVVGLQRVAAMGDELNQPVEVFTRKVSIGCCVQHFRVEVVREERRRAGHAEDVLG